MLQFSSLAGFHNLAGCLGTPPLLGRPAIFRVGRGCGGRENGQRGRNNMKGRRHTLDPRKLNQMPPAAD